MLSFHLGLSTHHPYQSQPWDWLVLSRPVAFSWVCPAGFVEGSHPTVACAASNSQEVLAIGTPMIWWGSIVTLLVCLFWWLTRRDWRAGAVLLAVAASWLPWFWFAAHDHRTEFYFYAVAFDPFLVLSITLCLGQSISGPPGHRRIGRGRLRAWRPAEFRLSLPGPGREGHSVHILAVPDVVPRLDLTRP